MKSNVKSNRSVNTSKETENAKGEASKNINDVFFNTIIDNIEKLEPSNWDHFLKDNLVFSPSNIVSKCKYTRYNKLILAIDILIHERKSFYYATFSQISQANGKLKKGSKSVPIQYFNFDIKHKETKQRISRSEYLKLSTTEQKNFTVHSFLKVYRVFSVEDIENFEACDFKNVSDSENEISEISLNEYAEDFVLKLIDKKGLKLEHNAQEMAFYSPSLDKICMPLTTFFKDEHFYYSTLFHEITHWTGHKSRLDRFDDTFVDGRNAYAFEELVAEIGALLFSSEFDYTHQFINSIVYLKSWLNQSNCEDKTLTMQEAFTLSNKACSFLKY